MGRVLQKHKDRVLQVLAEHPQGMNFASLSNKVQLVTVALENALGELKHEGLVTPYDCRFYLSREFNRIFRNAEAKEPVKSAHNKPRQSKKPRPLEFPTRGGVEEFGYKMTFLKSLRETHKNERAVARDIERIIDDFERMVLEREAEEREVA